MAQIFDNVSPFFDYLNSVRDIYYFRGYKYREQLKPSLGRLPGYKKNESRMFTDLSNFLDVKALNITSLRGLLELGQHYGLPTRFLDWSLNPFVALYFALGKKCAYDDEPVFIALLDKNSQHLTDVREIIDINITLSDLDHYTLGDLDSYLLSELDCFGPEVEHPDISNYLKFGLSWKKYEEYVSGIENFIMFSYKKDFINRRKEAQEGIFSFHKSADDFFPQELYEKIEIHFDVNQKNEATELLARMDIDAPVLFPDDGVYKNIEQECNRIKHEYENVIRVS